MPTYEYRCKNCEYHFEQMQKMSDDPLKECPECKQPTLQRLVNATAFHLKGSGWYKTDYASPSSSGASTGSPSSSSSTASSAGSDSSKSSSTSAATSTGDSSKGSASSSEKSSASSKES